MGENAVLEAEEGAGLQVECVCLDVVAHKQRSQRPEVGLMTDQEAVPLTGAQILGESDDIVCRSHTFPFAQVVGRLQRSGQDFGGLAGAEVGTVFE